MQLSSLPARISAIFAASAAPTSKNVIPLTQAGTTQPAQASFDVGFPAITMQPAASGGISPYGQDFNGLGNVLTAVQQWQSAGGLFTFDATFSSTVGGYPKGALLLKSGGNGFWQSTADNNTNNPDTGGANWQSITAHGVQTLTSSGSFTVPAGVTTVYVSAVAGGGGGGGSSGGSSAIASGSGGGAAGQSIIRTPYAVTPLASIVVTIGAAGSAASGASGGAGGNTVVGSLVTLTGGAGGSQGINTASPAGGGGGAGYPNGSMGTDGGVGSNGGPGASSPFGGGGGSGRGSSGGGQSGAAASGYGSGGGGGGGYYISGAGAASSGGAGAPGLVIFEY